MQEVLVNRLGGLSLPRKSVVRLTDRPDMTLDVYRGSKTTMQKQEATLVTRIGIHTGFLDLHLSISDGFVKTKIYDKRDDFDFDIVNFPFLYGDVPRSASYGIYISQLIRFARVSSHVDDFNTRNKVLTAKLLRQGYRYNSHRFYFATPVFCKLHLSF